jgi:hypothetical protein
MENDQLLFLHVSEGNKQCIKVLTFGIKILVCECVCARARMYVYIKHIINETQK